MRILMITDEGFENGGVSTYITSIKKELETRGHDVKILTSNMYLNDKRFNDYEFEEIKNRGTLAWYLKRLFNQKAYNQTKKLVQQINPDIVHVHYIDAQVSPSIFLALKKFPVVMTIHDFSLINPLGRIVAQSKKKFANGYQQYIKENYGSIKGYMYEKVRKRILGILLKHVDTFVTPNKGMEVYFKHHGYKKIQTIVNGVKLFDHAKIENYHTLLYVGRLSKEKGVEYVIRSMPEIIKKHPQVHLDIVGEGVEKDMLFNLTKALHMEKHITFVGQLANNQIEKYYKKATIVLVPSIGEEAFGLVGPEAMSVGRAVIGSRVGGITEWLTDQKTGFLVTPGNTVEIAEKVNLLLSDKNLLETMSSESSKESEKFSIKNNVDQLEKLYNQLTKK